AERPQEILEFSREVPQLHEKLIDDRRLRDIITYGNLFEGSAAWDDVPSEFEERNLPIAAWVKDEPFRDRAFWSSLEQADFAKQKFEFVVADREYFARAGKLSLLEAQKEKVIDDRISGQQLIIPHQGGDPFELMLQMIKGFLWHHYLNSPVIDTLMKEKAAEQFGQAFIYGYIDSFSFVTPINSSKKIMGGFIAGKALEIVSAMEFRPSMLRRDIVQIEPSREKLWQAYFADAHNSRRNRFVFSKKFDTTKSIPVKLVGLFEFWREKKKAADFMAELNNPSMIPFLEGIIGLPIRGLVSYIFSKTAIESVIVKQGLSAADIDCEGIIRQVIVAEAAAGNIRELFFEALKEYGVDFATGKAVRPRAPDGVLKQADGGIQLMLGAQDGYPYWQKYGNLVGAITFNQLKDMGVQYVFIHHSGLPLPDHLVRQKTFEAISNEITPIICLWETREDIDKDRAFPAIHKQLNRLVKPLGQHVQKVVLAYEPLWIVELALLRGYFTPAPAEEVEKMHLYIRDYLAQNAGSAPFADSVPIIAGPGASAGNAAEYMSRTSVDGLAVGAASVDPESFAQIVLNGAAHASTEKTPIFIANLKQENIACGIKQYWAEVETRLQGAVNDSRVVICPNMVDLVRISEKDGGAGQTTFDDFGQLALNVGNVRFHTTEYHRTFRSAIEKETWETYASWSDKYLWWMTFVVYSQDKGFYATVKVAPVANPRRQEKLSRYNYEGIVVINIETMDPQINSQALYAALMGRGLLGKSVSMLAPEIKKRRLFDWVQDGNIAYIINGRFISVNGNGLREQLSFPRSEYRPEGKNGSYHINLYLLLEIFTLIKQRVLARDDCRMFNWRAIFNPAIWQSKKSKKSKTQEGGLTRLFIPPEIKNDFNRRYGDGHIEYWIADVSTESEIVWVNRNTCAWLSELAQKDGGALNHVEIYPFPSIMMRERELLISSGLAGIALPPVAGGWRLNSAAGAFLFVVAPQRLGAVVIILVSSQRKHISRDGGLVSISRFSITPELEFNLETVSEERASRVFVPFRLGPQEAMFISGLPDDIVLGKGSALVAFLDPNQIALAVRAIDPSGKMTLGLVNIDTTKAGAFTEASVKRAIADLLERRGAVGADAPISFDLIPVTNYKGIDTQCSLQHAFGRKLGAQEFIQLKQAGVESSGVQEYETLKRIDTRSQAGYAHDKELFEFWPDWNGTARVKSGLYQIDGKIPGAYRADLENALNDLLQSMKNFREKAPPALSSDILTDSIYLSVTVDPRILREELGRVNINGILSNEHPANCVFLSPEAFSLSAAHKELLLLSLLLERKYLSVARVHSGLHHYYILNRPSLFRLLILLQEERHWSLARFSAVLMRAALARNPLHKLDYILGNTISADLLNFELRSGDIDIRHGSLLVSAGRLIDFVNRNYIVMRAHITGIPPSAVTIVVRDPANSRSAAIILQKTGADTWSLRAAAVERLAARRETGEDGLTVLIPLFAGEQYVEEDSECGDGGKYDLRWGCADFRLRAVKLWRANRKQDARTIAMLIDLLGDEAWGGRDAAKAALIDIGEPAIGALTAARSDLRQRVAEGAAAALKEIITKEARIDHERDNNVRAQEIGSGWKEPTQNGPRKEFKLDGGSRTRSGSPSNKAPARIISRQKLTGSLRNKPLYRVLHSLAGGIATRPALAEATGISESTVKYQINKLISLGLCERRPYQYFIKPGVSAREIIEHQFVREPLYRVFEAISRGNDTGTEVARSTGIPAATVWKQLKCLCSCNVIERTGNHYAVRRSNEHQLLAGRSLLRKPLWMVFNAIAEGNTTRALIISATGINPNTLDEQIRDLIDQGLVLREQPHYRLTMRIAPDTAMGALIDALVKKGEVFVQEDLRQKIVSIRREMPRSNIRAVTRELADHNIAVDRAKISKLFKNDIMATDEEIKTAMLATGSAVRAAAYIKTVFAKTIDRETVAARSRKLAAADPGYNALLTQTAIPGLEDMQNAFDAAQGCIVPACRILRGKGFKALVTDPRWAVIQSSWMEHVWGELNELERTFLGLAVHTAPDIFMAKDIYQKTIPLGKILMQNEHYSLKQLVHTLNEFSPCLIEKVSSPPQGNSYRIEAGFRFFILNKMPENPETSCIVGVNALTQRIRDIISAQGVNGINLDYSQFARDYPHLAAYYDYLKQSKQIEPRWRVWKTFVLDIEPAVGHANGLVHKKYDIRDMLMAVLELRIKSGGLTFDQTEKIDRLIGNLSKGCIPEHLGRPSRPWTLTIKNQLRSLNQQGKLEEEFLKRREFIDAVPLRDGGAGAHSSRTEIFKPVFFKYLLGLHQFVRGERAVYAGSMSDIAGIAYATDCTEYAFIDNTPFSPIAVPWEYGTEDEWLCRYFNKKFRTSYSIDGDAPYIRLALIEELARMGAQDIVVREEQEKVFTVDFSWRHPLRAESAQRTITYYECDISNPLTALKESVSRGFDIYFQKAPLKLSVPRYRFLAEALGYMMPGGFIVCDTDLFGIDSVHERRPAIESHFTQVILPDAMTNGVTYGYSTKGALMWQKNRADGGNEAALTKQELRALWRELFREAQEQYPTKLLEIDGESANTFLVYSDKP
ncbi:MAG: triose-phosphate isomerase, partial [Candidatus Omnitrophica bacterium]|nr:triose-phosphate isomerase [Candidatus Omnitrophota bacterium]